MAIRIPIGFGALMRAVQGSSDGTVAVEETKLAGMRSHAALPVTHTGLLAAPSVARYTCVFLKTGRFPPD